MKSFFFLPNFLTVIAMIAADAVDIFRRFCCYTLFLNNTSKNRSACVYRQIITNNNYDFDRLFFTTIAKAFSQSSSSFFSINSGISTSNNYYDNVDMMKTMYIISCTSYSSFSLSNFQISSLSLYI